MADIRIPQPPIDGSITDGSITAEPPAAHPMPANAAIPTDVKFGKLAALIVDVSVNIVCDVIDVIRKDLGIAVDRHRDLFTHDPLFTQNLNVPTANVQVQTDTITQRPPTEERFYCVTVGLATGVFPGPWYVVSFSWSEIVS